MRDGRDRISQYLPSGGEMGIGPDAERGAGDDAAVPRTPRIACILSSDPAQIQRRRRKKRKRMVPTASMVPRAKA